MRIPLLLCLLFIPLALTRAQSVVGAQPAKQLSIVRVNVTNQGFDFVRPWGKRPPFARRGIGAVLPNKRVLVTAELVANANYVELEAADGGQKAPASVDVVDYEANLALLKTDDTSLLKDLPPLDLTVATVGDTLSVWQLEANGNLLVTRGPMTSVEVSRYPIDESSFLLYRMTASLQFRDSSFVLPVVKDDKLVGLVMRYEGQSNNADIVPTPIIEHFLRDAAQQPYKGFPRAGMSFSGTRDPQLRRYVGLPENAVGGVYITDVTNDGPSDKAGLQKGDILLRVDDQPVDQDGNYVDPVYGKIAVSHLLSGRHNEGDVVKFTAFRQGSTKDLSVTLGRRPIEDYVSEPYVIDRAPKFYILGGLVLQELSRQYLKEWGPDWQKKAPEDLVYMDRAQGELFPDGHRKIVFLSRVLPSDATVGYEDLHHLIVSKINDVPLQSLADVPKALEKAVNGLHKVEFTSDPTVIYLDAQQVATSEAILAKTYRLPSLKRLE
ncbi:PDZ domain-containing protein [Verrucomicrobiota bacterium sgz303538]